MAKRSQPLHYLMLFAFLEWLIIAYFSGYWHFWLTTPALYSDPNSYFFAAKDLIYKMHPDQIRPLGISLLFSIPLFFSDSLRFFIIVNVLLQFGAWLWTIYTLYQSCLFIYDKKESVLVTLLFSIALSPLAMSFMIMSETYFMFFLVLAFYFFVRFIKSEKTHFLLMGYFLLCFATIVRPLTYYVVILFTIILIAHFAWRSLNRRWINILFTIGIFLSTIGVQLGGMYFTYRVLTLSDTMGKVMWMWAANGECIANGRNDLDHCVSEWMNEAVSQSELEKKELNVVIKEKFLGFAKTNPMTMIRAYLVSLKYNLIGGSYALNGTNTFGKFLFSLSRIQNLFFSFLLFVSAIFLFLKIIKRRVASVSLIIWVAIFLSLYLYLMGGFFYWQGDRYNVPAFPLICFVVPFLYKGLKDLWNEIRNRNTRVE